MVTRVSTAGHIFSKETILGVTVGQWKRFGTCSVSDMSETDKLSLKARSAKSEAEVASHLDAPAKVVSWWANTQFPLPDEPVMTFVITLMKMKNILGV